MQQKLLSTMFCQSETCHVNLGYMVTETMFEMLKFQARPFKYKIVDKKYILLILIGVIWTVLSTYKYSSISLRASLKFQIYLKKKTFFLRCN